MISTNKPFITNNGTLYSPIAYTTSEMDINTPVGAVELILQPSTDIQISENEFTSYDLIYGGMKESFPVESNQIIKIKGDTSGGLLYIRFTLN